MLSVKFKVTFSLIKVIVLSKETPRLVWRAVLRILPIPDSPESPEPEVEPDDFDETHLVVEGNDDPGILLVSPSPPRPLGRVLAASVPPRLLSAN